MPSKLTCALTGADVTSPAVASSESHTQHRSTVFMFPRADVRRKAEGAKLTLPAGWLCTVGLLLHVGACRSEPTPLRSPASLGCDLAAEAPQVARTWMADHPPTQLAWNWGEGVLMYGLWQWQAASGDRAAARYVHRYLRHHQQAPPPIQWSDHTTPARAAAQIVLSGDDSPRPVLDRVVSYIEHAPRTPHRKLIRHLGDRIPRWLVPGRLPDVWIDSAFHLLPTLAQAGRLRQQAHLVDEAVRQLEGFASVLQDPQTDLFTHAFHDREQGTPIPSFAERAFWARGNGWMLATLVEMLDEIPETHPARPRLRERLLRLTSALSRAQSEGGLFHTVLLDSRSYEETAGSALIAYGLARGRRTGHLPDSLESSAQRALSGLCRTLSKSEGRTEVVGTSLGTNPNARRYARVARQDQVSYGVGAWLLAASEAARLRR